MSSSSDFWYVFKVKGLVWSRKGLRGEEGNEGEGRKGRRRLAVGSFAGMVTVSLETGKKERRRGGVAGGKGGGDGVARNEDRGERRTRRRRRRGGHDGGLRIFGQRKGRLVQLV